MRQLKPDELSPHILFCNYYVGMDSPKIYQIAPRLAYDYELELITHVDNGYMIQQNRKITLKPGDLLFRRPGDATQGCNRYNSYITCFEALPTNRTFNQAYQLEDAKTFQDPVMHMLLDSLKEQFPTSHMTPYISGFKAIYNAFIHPQLGASLYMKALLIEMLYKINQELKAFSDYRHPKRDLVKQVQAYILSHYKDDLSLESLAHYFDYSPIYFHQIFKEVTGMTLAKYVTDQRMEKAKESLLHTKVSIKTICFSVGYHNPSYFSMVFQRHTGFSPKHYRATYQVIY